MGPTDIVYDPTEMQIREIDKMLNAEELSVANLVKNPQAIQLLLRQQAVLLHELRNCKSELDKSVASNEKLREEREMLRISAAQLNERYSVSIIEIPISIASGFAINMITNKPLDITGWVLLLISFLLILFLRQFKLFAVFSGLKSKKEDK